MISLSRFEFLCVCLKLINNIKDDTPGIVYQEGELRYAYN